MFDKKNYQHEKNAMKQQNKHNNTIENQKKKKWECLIIHL
jgi:hypothetical protein